MHTWVAAQRRPQPPQFAGSARVSMHLPPQDDVPSGHPHPPPVQTSPAGQV